MNGTFLCWKGILSLWGAANDVLQILDIESPLFARQLCICLDAFFVVSFVKCVCMVYGCLYRVDGNLEEGDDSSNKFLVGQGDTGSVCRKCPMTGS